MYKNLLSKGIQFLKKNSRKFAVYAFVILTLYSFMLLIMCNPVHADPPKQETQPVLVSGTVKLFKAITSWLLLIIPVGAGAVLGYHALQKSLSDDQAVIAEKNKLMKNVIIGAAIAETASGLVTLILVYYS